MFWISNYLLISSHTTNIWSLVIVTHFFLGAYIFCNWVHLITWSKITLFSKVYVSKSLLLLCSCNRFKQFHHLIKLIWICKRICINEVLYFKNWIFIMNQASNLKYNSIPKIHSAWEINLLSFHLFIRTISLYLP